MMGLTGPGWGPDMGVPHSPAKTKKLSIMEFFISQSFILSIFQLSEVAAWLVT